METNTNSKEDIKEEVLTFLRNNNTGVVSTIFQGEISASTVHYIIDDNWNIYFLTQDNTKKYFNISSNQKAVMVVGTGPKHISFQAKGIAHELMDEKMREILPKFHWLKESGLIKHWPIEEMKKFEDRNLSGFVFEPTDVVFFNLDDDSYPLSKGLDYHDIVL